MQKEEMLAIFTLLKVEVWNYWQLPNGYWPPAYTELRENNPWWLVQTKYGLIRIGNRKRAIHIDWEATPYRVEVTTDDVTKDEKMVHAWSIAKAIEYLGYFFEHAKQQSEPPIIGHWRHGNGFIVCGTLNIAREDFDTNPTDEVKKEILTWMCDTLNKAR